MGRNVKARMENGSVGWMDESSLNGNFQIESVGRPWEDRRWFDVHFHCQEFRAMFTKGA